MLQQISQIPALVQPGSAEDNLSRIEGNVQRLFEVEGLSLGGQVSVEDLEVELQRAQTEFDLVNGGPENSDERRAFEEGCTAMMQCFLNIL